jgi:AraC family transcriptional regulator, activator of mtrCDE
LDILTTILDSLRLKGQLYFRTELTSPWGIHVPFKHNVARFHIVIRGNAWLNVDGQNEPLAMVNGDLFIVTRGSGHDILDAPQTEPRPLDEVLSEVNYTGSGPLIYGGGGMGCTLVCGEFAFEREGPNPLLDSLPAVLHVPGGKGLNPTWLESTLGFIAHEAASEQIGAFAVVDRLAEIIFIQVVRAYVNSPTARVPFLAALGDPQISRALGLIHVEPSFNWTVAELGQRIGMSRSAFSNRFSELVGMTPYQYVTSVRMQQATRRLKTTDESIMLVAQNVGYESEAAFSAAFKQHFGARPGEYRRRQHTEVGTR